MVAVAAIAIMETVWPAEGLAAWNGASTSPACTSNTGGLDASCPTVSEACQSWAMFYGTWVKRIDPGFDSLGNLTGYTCWIQHFLAAGGDIPAPTFPSCPPGEVTNGQLPDGCSLPFSPKGLGQCDGPCRDKGYPKAGNPINISTGNKFDTVTDFESAGPDTLAFIRYYNSYERRESMLGIGWRSNFDRHLWFNGTTQIITTRADGGGAVYNLVGSNWVPDADVTERLTQNGSNWLVTDDNDTVETYDSLGKLISVVKRNGYQQTLTYDATGLLTSVTDTYGRQLTFTHSGIRLATMTDPDGHVYAYSYGKTLSLLPQANLLTSVSYPDDTPSDTTDNPTITYLYENTAHPFALTGILDENGERYATYAYNGDGRAILSEHANGADHTEIVFHPDFTRTVTGPTGQQEIYHFALIQGSYKVTQIDRLASASVPAATFLKTYDAFGFVASTTDWNGNVINFVNNARGLQISRTEAAGTPQVRTITTTWHPTFRLPTQIQEPGKTTDFTYDANGFLLTRTETDTTGGPMNGQTRTWTFTYTPTGLVATVDGPRTNVTDVTTNTYTTQGYLKTVTNALGHVTDITSHNSRGLPLVMKDANNVETHLAYHPRGLLRSTTVKSSQGDATTTLDYDLAGQLIRITRPDGSVLNYEYDAAHRVAAVSNNLGERIEYALDAAGNRTTETVKSATSTIVRTQSRTFDTLSRLLAQIGASTQTTTYAYDANGNTISITDPLTHATTQAFDSLNRLIKVTDAKSGEADYTYDGQDNLTTVEDQRNLTTTYAYNGFGDVLQMASPDTGTTTYQVDAAGNRTQQTDARGIVTTYSYDALNRVISMQFPGNPAENVTYTYDAIVGGNKGIGRLTGIADESGTTTLVHDDRGNVITETRQIGTQSYSTQYVYDLANNLAQITYPSGRVVTYQRDALGRVTNVTTQASAGAAPTVLASAITYQPFGPIASLTYGNGLVLTLSYDQDYRLTEIRTADGATVVQDLDYTYDAADNITAIADVLNATRNQTFTYDELHRLIGATGVYGTTNYTYDPVGNRLTRALGGATETYAYAGSSNRLLSVTSSAGTRPFGYTANGQITSDARPAGDVFGLLYNHANRLSQLTKNSLPDMDYRYNALGQRVLKDRLGAGTTDVHYHYDREGRLIAESDMQGNVAREYIHLEGLPLAVIDAGSGGTPTLDLILDNTQPNVLTTGAWPSASTVPGYEGTDYLDHAAYGLPSGGETIDNTSPGFSTTGIWTPSQAVSGAYGTDYSERAAADPEPATLIVDNTSADFTALGNWQTAAGNPQAEGPDYRWHLANQWSYTAQIIDNTDPGFNAVGSWNTWTSSGHQGPDYRWHGMFPVWLPPGAIIVDNRDATTSYVGWWWWTQNVPGYIGVDYFWHTSAAGTSFTWTPVVPATKLYHVYAR